MRDRIFPITHHNHVELFYDGKEYGRKFLEMIKNAQVSIHLQTYIFDMDEFGKKVHTELILASKRGVQVYVLVDSVGSRLFKIQDEISLKKEGVYFFRFNGIQWDWLYRWGRRLHHKVLLVDQIQSMVGGINITSPFPNGSLIPRLDFAICLEGAVNRELSNYCQNIFQSFKGDIFFSSTKKSPHRTEGLKVSLAINDWVHRRRKITKEYFHLANRAKKEIVIINSYFFPRRKFMKALVMAAKRGVRVRLILPKYSDWPSYILASEYLYDYFLKRGVEIYLWEKSILHGKLAIVDDNWSTIGSFNLNYTSYQQNLEMNVDIHSKEFNTFLSHEIYQLIQTGCEKIDPVQFLKKSPWKTRASRFFFYLILSVIAGFSFALNFQEQENNNKENRVFNILRIIISLFFFLLGVVGTLLPIVPGFPFFILSFLLVYRQILLNKRLG